MCMVDLVTGRLSLSETDFELPGPLPLTLKRRYRSTNLWRGDLGYGWGHSLGLQLARVEGRLMLRGADGRRIPFDLPAKGKPFLQSSEKAALLLLEPADLPWPELRSELSEGVYLFQPEGPIGYLFDVRPGPAGILPWRAVVDGDQNLVRVTPDDQGRPARLETPQGQVLSLRRDDQGRLVEVEVVNRRATYERRSLVRYEYDAAGDLVAVRDDAGTRTYVYREHLLIRHRDRAGGTCTSEFDAAMRCVLIQGPDGVKRREYHFDPEAKTTRVTDGLGHTSTYQFDENGAAVRTVDPAGGVSAFDYDCQGRLVRATNQSGKETTLCYSADGRQVGKVRPDGSSVSIETNPQGRVTRITTFAQAVTAYQLDARGHVVEAARPQRGTCRFAYAADGSLEKVTTPTGKEVALAWTPDRRTLKESDAAGPLTEQQFDLRGRLLRHRDALAAETQYRYDGAGYLGGVVFPDGASRQYTSDPEGRLLTWTDEAGAVTRWDYDAAGSCVKVTLANGQPIRCEFDGEKRLTGIQGPDRLWHRYHYDARGKVVRQEYGDGRVEHYAYDPVGFLTRFTDGSGAAIEVERDDVGRLARVAYPDGTAKLVWHDEDGRWVRVEWDGHVLERELTPEGQAVVESQDDYVLRRTFGDAGQLLETVDSLGRKLAYGYDEDGRVIQIQVTPGAWDEDTWAAAGAPRVHQFEYDRVGNLVLWKMPGEKVEQRTYDLRRRLVGQTVLRGEQVLLRREYVYDPAGRLTARRDSHHGNQVFVYDHLNRLRGVRSGQVSETYDYSPAGDLELPGVSYAPGHRPEHVKGRTLHYDGRGFPVRRGADSLRFSSAGLLREVSAGGQSRARYDYDPHARLVRKTTPARSCRYFWDGDALVALRPDDGEPVEFLYLPGTHMLLEQCQGGVVYTAHGDQLNKVRELLDAEGAVAWANPGGTWGAGRKTAAPAAGGVECPFGFPGQLWDADTGLYYNRYRFYDPDSAHYLTPDPVGLWAGLDVYRYVPDPVNTIDPLGLKCEGKANEPIIYRTDTRPPSEICANGFSPRNPAAGLSVIQHVNGIPGGGSNFVATTHSLDWAENTGLGGDLVYVIDNPGCGIEVDCDPDVQAQYGADPAASEHEILFSNPIPGKKIVGFFSKSAGGIASFQACP